MPLHTSHMTAGQFSAFLDQQLSASELSTCQAHLNTCASCQQQLTELQQTLLLLRALPRASLPQSFLLPAKALAGEKTAPSPNLVRQAPNRILVFPSSIRSTMRITSTLVAALGLFFMLSGLLTIAPLTAEIPPISTPAAINVKFKAPNSSSKVSKYPSFGREPAPQAPEAAVDSSHPAVAPQTPANPRSSTIASTPNIASNTPHQQPWQSSTKPFFDADTAQGHLSIGILLLIIGIVGVTLFTKLGKKA